MINFKQLFMLSFSVSVIHAGDFEKTCEEIMRHPQPDPIVHLFKKNEAYHQLATLEVGRIEEELHELLFELHTTVPPVHNPTRIQQKNKLLKDLKASTCLLQCYHERRHKLVKRWKNEEMIADHITETGEHIIVAYNAAQPVAITTEYEIKINV